LETRQRAAERESVLADRLDDPRHDDLKSPDRMTPAPPAVPTGSASARTTEIDGLRGWASLAVLLFHMLCVVFGEQFSGIRGNPYKFALVNGPLAVFVFFVLSGDALSIAYLRSGDRRVIDSLLIRRYFRLMVPVAMATLLVFALMKTGLVFNKPAGQIATFYGWLGGVIDFVPRWQSYASYVLLEVFNPLVVYGAPPAIYNPMLWTMSVELAGSGLVFLFWYLRPSIRRPRSVLAVLVLALAALGSLYALFFFGVLLSQWRSDGSIDRWRARRAAQIGAPLVAVAAALLHARFSEGAPAFRHVSLLCSIVLVVCLYTSRPALRILRSRFSRYLGEISFPLYLTHFAVIVSLTSFLIVRQGSLSTASALGISAASIVAALLLASAFRAIERAVLRRFDARLNALLLARPLRAG
jgi:peptidoglycan/LPS O-acetylase OafA/YrhL